MQMWTYGSDSLDVTKIGDPTSKDVEGTLATLNNSKPSGFSLYSGIFGLLQVFGGERDRVTVTFKQDERIEGRQYGRMTDESFNDGDTDVQLVINVSGESTNVPGHFTVSKETALKVALYFLENEAPPRGYSWEGNMEKFA